jgi:hypothetical protein
MLFAANQQHRPIQHPASRARVYSRKFIEFWAPAFRVDASFAETFGAGGVQNA